MELRTTQSCELDCCFALRFGGQVCVGGIKVWRAAFVDWPPDQSGSDFKFSFLASSAVLAITRNRCVLFLLLRQHSIPSTFRWTVRRNHRFSERDNRKRQPPQRLRSSVENHAKNGILFAVILPNIQQDNTQKKPRIHRTQRRIYIPRSLLGFIAKMGHLSFNAQMIWLPIWVGGNRFRKSFYKPCQVNFVWIG